MISVYSLSGEIIGAPHVTKRFSNVNDSEVISDNTVSSTSSKRVKRDPKILDGKYFTINIRKDDKVKAICSLCGTQRWGSIIGTGNFYRHIKDAHAERRQEVDDYIKSTSTKITKFKQTKLSGICTVEQVNNAISFGYGSSFLNN